MTTIDTPVSTVPSVSAVQSRTRHRRRRGTQRLLIHAVAVVLTLFMALPVYLIAVSAFSTRAAVYRFPKDLWPKNFSIETVSSFANATGVIPAALNSVIVALLTVVLVGLVGAPAGYALARIAFRGKNPYKILLLMTRALPIVVLSVPLARIFIVAGVYDSIGAVVLVHSALSLPTTVLIMSSIFVGVPKDVEEAARVFGCTRMEAFGRVVLPMALPGVVASSLFTFVGSWNEVLGASILTLNNRTLPALVLTALADSPLEFRFAGGFMLVVPALLFIFLMRKYLLNMWGTTLR